MENQKLSNGDEIQVYIFSVLGKIRFTEQGALELAQNNYLYKYKDLEESYKDNFHYFTEMTPEDIDNFIS